MKKKYLIYERKIYDQWMNKEKTKKRVLYKKKFSYLFLFFLKKNEEISITVLHCFYIIIL